MNVASLELCKKLFELSGWNGADKMWEQWTSRYNEGGLAPPQVANEGDADRDFQNGLLAWQPIPAYDLGYLLRKLPTAIDLTHYSFSPWAAGYFGELVEDKLTSTGDTPEDAACKLAIELFKQGILTKETPSTNGKEPK